MRVFYGFENLPEVKSPVVAMGSFDGVHHGHRLLIGKLREIALENGGESVAITFEPHPRTVLKGEKRLLTTLEEKIDLMTETGVDNLLVIDFTKEFSEINYKDFIEQYIVGKLHTAVLLTGKEHNFGHNREGTLQSVESYGIKTVRLDRYHNISSTQIRDAIEAGDIKHAAKLLESRGYLIKAPLKDPFKLLPPQGEYMVEYRGEIGRMKIGAVELSEMSGSVLVLERI